MGKADPALPELNGNTATAGRVSRSGVALEVLRALARPSSSLPSYWAYLTLVVCAAVSVAFAVLGAGVAVIALSVLLVVAVYKGVAISVDHERQAMRDQLTGLASRRQLARRCAEALADARRNGSMLALFVLDLDRFKEVNDTLGHAVGDRVLQIAGARLAGSLRPGDIVARLGGDEFAVLLPRVRDAAVARELAARVRVALQEPIFVDDLLIDIDASVGVALNPAHGTDFEALFRHADVAMYVAKSECAGIEVYAAEKDQNSLARLGLLGALRRGIDAGQLELYYQPKVDLISGEVVGVEALVRWRHPERGLVLPDDFIPLAEQSGMMQQLTDMIIETALAQAAQWWGRGLHVPVAVNVSMRDLLDPGLAERLAEGLRRRGLPAEALSLEITERILMADPERAAVTLSALGALGVHLSLDDFGTGYSSLVLLKRLPVQEIKVDRSFVARVALAGDDATIVRSIVDLGHALGLRVVAEGVEDDATRQRLRELGCDHAQGWHIGGPMSAGEALDWLIAARRRMSLRAV